MQVKRMQYRMSQMQNFLRRQSSTSSLVRICSRGAQRVVRRLVVRGALLHRSRVRGLSFGEL